MKKLISILMSFAFAVSSVMAGAESVEEQTPVADIVEEVPVMKELYVSVNGSDSNDGSKIRPFATVEKAKEEAKKYNDNMTGDIVINIGAGVYYVDKTLYFTKDDSASNGYSVIFKGDDAEKTILSGGRQITGWKLHDGNKNIWSADAKGIDSRTMFVNGERRNRAAHTANLPNIVMSAEPEYTVEGNNIFADIPNITDVEIIWMLSFSDWRMPITGINGNKIDFPEIADGYGNAKGVPMRVENAYKWLDEKGEWYLDKLAGKIYYIPKDGEDMAKEVVTLGVLEEVINIEGTEKEFVKGLSFEELTVKDVTWLGPNDPDYGYANFQAGFCREFDKHYGDNDKYNVNAAIHAVFAEDIRVKRCIVRNCGGAGIWFRKGIHNSDIVGNVVYDISQNGIMTDSTFPGQSCNPVTICDGISIENNIVHDAGIEYLGAVGIFGGMPRNSSVSHNIVYNIPYTCISFGWGWMNQWTKDPEKIDEYPMLNVGNRVNNNYVYNGMTKLRDGGGLYFLGVLPELEVKGNVVANMGKNESFAYYFDNGSRWATFTENVCYDVAVALYSKGADNEFFNNYFDVSFDNTSVIGDQRQGHSEYKSLAVQDESHKNKIYDNVVVKDGNFPDFIMMNAGVEYEYQDLAGLVGSKDENIATVKTAKAKVLKQNGTYGKFITGKGYAAAIDKNTETEMKATGKEAWTCDVDLGNKRHLTSFKIVFGTNVPEKVKITVSEDAKNFTEIPVDVIEKENVFEIDEVVRKIQIQVLEGEMSIAELEVYADDFISVVDETDRFANFKLVTFDDISGHWAQTDIEYLASLGIVKGDYDDKFSPDRAISRAEWIALITRVFEIQKEVYLNEYADVSDTDWFADNIQAARNKGLIRLLISEGRVYPEKEITREEAAYVLMNCGIEVKEKSVVDFVDIDKASYEFREGILSVASNGFMTGRTDSEFAPKNSLTRAEAATIVKRVLDV